jgi:hypothetical protein
MIQRKTATLVEDYEYICRQDAAVDRPPDIEPEDPEDVVQSKKKALAEFDLKWEHYADGKGPCPLVPGGKPTRFKLRHLNTVSMGRLAPYFARAETDKSAWPQLLVAAFTLGVAGVENYCAPDGKPIKAEHEMDEGLHGCPVLSAKSFNEFEMSIVFEVGARIVKRQNPDPK